MGWWWLLVIFGFVYGVDGNGLGWLAFFVGILALYADSEQETSAKPARPESNTIRCLQCRRQKDRSAFRADGLIQDQTCNSCKKTQERWDREAARAKTRKCVRCKSRRDLSAFEGSRRICQRCRAQSERTCPKCKKRKPKGDFERAELISGIGRICNACAGSTETLEIKAAQEYLSGNADSPRVLRIRLRGSLPENKRGRETSFWTSVLVKDGSSLKPVKTAVELYSEAETDAYLHRTRMGQTSDWPGWSNLGVVFPEILIPPRGGEQTIEILSRIVDTANPPPIRNGRVATKSHPGILWTGKIVRNHTFSGRGYLDEFEALEAHEETRTLAVRIAVGVAFVDETGFDKQEGAAISGWMETQVRNFHPHLRESLKRALNHAFKDSHQAGNIGKRRLDGLAAKLLAVGGVTDRYRAIALCATVMAADRVADASEMATIHSLARKLDLDAQRVQELIRERTTQLDLNANQSSAEDFYGIDPSWDRDKICRFIRGEFTQTNGMLSVLKPGIERENVKKQQEALARLHKKYGCGGAS